MKTVLAFFLTFSLMVAILAPSINIILELDGNQMVWNLNEEEENNNQQLKEIKEKLLIAVTYKSDLEFFTNEKLLFLDNNIHIIASNNIEVSLPPPKAIG